ncbi:zinc finger E-box-binding homeobox 1 isoform X3 [Zeugodacus cucurbitae]|uniref:zinc finger E-box-binding homeobox 1 isoform X3 n=1 Tax=Zeugodacus cucurbitae TaxID=28588 RepID=UPI0023D9036A|nr:zinc finger E-box-binding homeobox 1 isoform X3 [Zeugodacus cucurbitae]
MNFSPFGNTFPGTTTIPGLPQFTTTAAPQVSTVTSAAAVAGVTSQGATQQDETASTSARYQPQQQQQQQQSSANVSMTHFNQPAIPIATGTTVTALHAKFRTSGDEPQGDKYNGHLVTIETAGTSGTQQQPQYAAIAYPQNTITASSSTAAVGAAITNTPQQQQLHVQQQQQQQVSAPQELTQDLCNAILQQQGVDTKLVLQNTSWQSLTPGTTVADYLSHLPANTLPLSLHHFLKYSAETIKKENQGVVQTGAPIGINTIGGTTTITIPQQQTEAQIQQPQQHQEATTMHIQADPSTSDVVTMAPAVSATTTSKKKKRKKRPKDRKPKLRPGEIRLTTALDGSPLYLCPECQVAYPEPDLLEIHLVGHNLERRYICDICQAALKRKDHLTRHKQSHNPERPYICTVCLKAFKRKEQLSLHFVIHSGEKRHLCHECGKGFYRKDHLRKHTRSHIARRVKAELSMQNESEHGTSMLQPITVTTITEVQPQSSSSAQLQQHHSSTQQQQQQQQQQLQQQMHTQQMQHVVVTQQQQQQMLN